MFLVLLSLFGMASATEEDTLPVLDVKWCVHQEVVYSDAVSLSVAEELLRIGRYQDISEEEVRRLEKDVVMAKKAFDRAQKELRKFQKRNTAQYVSRSREECEEMVLEYLRKQEEEE